MNKELNARETMLAMGQAARQAAQNAATEADTRAAEHWRSLRQSQPPTINLHARP